MKDPYGSFFVQRGHHTFIPWYNRVVLKYGPVKHINDKIPSISWEVTRYRVGPLQRLAKHPIKITFLYVREKGVTEAIDSTLTGVYISPMLWFPHSETVPVTC